MCPLELVPCHLPLLTQLSISWEVTPSNLSRTYLELRSDEIRHLRVSSFIGKRCLLSGCESPAMGACETAQPLVWSLRRETAPDCSAKAARENATEPTLWPRWKPASSADYEKDILMWAATWGKWEGRVRSGWAQEISLGLWRACVGQCWFTGEVH